MDIEKEIRAAIKEGRVVIGNKKVKKSLLMGTADSVVISKELPSKIKDELHYYASLSNITCYDFSGSSKDLGYICAKPFPVSSLSIIKSE
jgi:large subunit ribosomal protein L30e